jgi:hypothetical protein
MSFTRMRLVNTHTGALEDFTGRKLPPYAILSHTWDGDEITYQDFADSLPGEMLLEMKPRGMRKVSGACRVAAPRHDYIWIDSCCIDKADAQEISEAINSMFHWYAEADVCYVFLSDFEAGDVDATAGFREARWFTRGWTLQELVAPSEVHFFDANWQALGTRRALSTELARITGVDEALLRATTQAKITHLLRNTTAARKMSWAARRETSRTEDLAYCLLGLFEVNMPLLYGERSHAFIRLQEEIMKNSNDLSLFGWQAPANALSSRNPEHVSQLHVHCRGILAVHPREFADAARLSPSRDALANPEFSMSNKGLRIAMPLRQLRGDAPNLFFMPLFCHDDNTGGDGRIERREVGIYLWRLGGSGNIYARASPDMLGVDVEDRSDEVGEETLIYVSKNVDRMEMVQQPLTTATSEIESNRGRATATDGYVKGFAMKHRNFTSYPGYDWQKWLVRWIPRGHWWLG